jgi:hypothetical protein
MATNAVCTSFKSELLSAVHCFNATMSSLTGAGANSAFTITGLTTTAGIVVGMAAAGTGVAASAAVSKILSATSVQVDIAHTGTVTSGTISFTGDVINIALVKAAPATTFAGTQTNVGTPGTGASSVTNLGTDETSGTGYTSGGLALTNVSPVISGTTAFIDFAPDPSWTTATFSATAAITNNRTVRAGHANGITANASGSAIGRTIEVLDFGGTQTVTAGTFTVVFPVADASNAILRIA